MTFIARLVVLANLVLAVAAVIVGVPVNFLAAGALAAVSLILWHVLPAREASEAGFGLWHVPDDHPVREKLGAKD